MKRHRKIGPRYNAVVYLTEDLVSAELCALVGGYTC
jgi:hypothetical protein